MKYLIFLCPRFENEAKRGVDYHHLTCTAWRIQLKAGNGMSYFLIGEQSNLTLGFQVPFAYPAMCGI